MTSTETGFAILSNGSDRSASIVRGLELAGWTLVSMEVDAIANTGRVEVVSFDGRVVTLDVRGGKGTVTREQRTYRTETVGRRGDRMPVERVGHSFLGRTAVAGVRSGLRMVADYIADNAPAGALPRSSARALLAPLLW